MALRPQWEWRLDAADGTDVERPGSPVFTSQYDAEQWIGEHWRSLAAAGVASATLLHEGEPAAPPLPIPAV
ncbi:hypothetical protein [Cellulomonas sp. HZM]|uniref:hypothetical protein n=1 Tax=Cellulomonas sp. HZM TaxID=1454010 RepID=UPI0004931F51|nr:hypothetical protein [Cellulomonas sp. HZM]